MSTLNFFLKSTSKFLNICYNMGNKWRGTMKRRGLFLLFVLLILFVTGCRTDFDNNNTKLINMSFNKPIGYKDSRYPIGNLEDGREYEMRIYDFNDYSIKITGRDKDTFKKYTKDSDIKYTKKTINDKKYKYGENDNTIYYITEHMDGLYVFEFSGNKSEENVAVFTDLIKSAKYRE